jgi:hypothetical protein
MARAALDQGRDGGRAARREGAVEERRTEAVDDDQDELAVGAQRSTRRPAYLRSCTLRARRPNQAATTSSA